MRVHASGRSRSRVRRRLFLAGIILLVGLLSSLYLVRFFEIRRLQHELAVLTGRMEAALQEQQGLRTRLSLANNPEAIEEAARDLLGLVKPGEEKVIFIEGD